jgi:hypothetical protein
VSRLEAYGLAVDPPSGWEGEIFQRPVVTATELRSAGVAVAADAPAGGVPTPIVHLANFPMPAQRGDYGGGAVELMGRGHVFAAVLAHDPAEASSPIFARQGVPWPLRAEDFDPNQMQRTFSGQSGCQRFFRVGERPFCLYVALGSHRMRALLVREVNAALATVDLG